MISIARLPISQAKETLCKRKEEVSKITSFECKKAKARELFKKKNNRAFQEVRSTLKKMNGGSDACMYCMCNEGRSIDHFEPLSRNPDRAFDWDNYFWACDVCNSNHKRDQFPLHHGKPLLINPVDDEPCDYLALTADGLFVRFPEEHNETNECIFRRLKNNVSIDVFQLNKREMLITSRKAAWLTLQKAFLPEYAKAKKEDNDLKAQDMKKMCQHPCFASILAFLWKMNQDSPNASLLICNSTIEIFHNHPEIGCWLLPESRLAVTSPQ